MNHTPAVSRLKALADPTRIRLLHLLEKDELAVGEATGLLGMTQSRVSGHLAVLREAGLVRDRRQGTSSYYSLVPDGDARSTWDAVRDTLPGSEQVLADRARLDELLERRRERAREFFDRASEKWDDGRSESLGHHAAAAALGGLLPRDLTVVDLGTGTGAMLPALARRLARVWAVDASRGMLRKAAQRTAAEGLRNVQFVHADLESLPWPDAGVDGVIANMVLHHLENPAAALREMARVLRDGGRGVIVDFEAHDESWLLEEENHRWAGFNPAQVGGWCVDAGLTVPDFVRVPTPDSGRWARLEVFTAGFDRRPRR
jgi:ArsR family transcriptional regulator